MDKVGGWPHLLEGLRSKARILATQDKVRELRQNPCSRSIIDLTHNDYLGIKANSDLQSRCRSRIAALPVGAGASRLLGGEEPIFRELENRFSNFKSAEASLFFNSGYSANLAITRALHLKGSAFFADTQIHASTIDGLRLSAIPPKRKNIFPHNDLGALESFLKKSDAPLNVIFAETLYSMDGDSPNLEAIQSLALENRGILVLDEAHAVGCYGIAGKGLIDHSLGNHDNVISINPCGKAFGASGAFISGPKELKQHLINTARPFIYSTGSSPWIAGALIEIIDFVEKAGAERARLQSIAKWVRKEISKLGYTVLNGDSHIIPIITFENNSAIDLREKLAALDILVSAIRPPTVAENTARIRLSLSAALTDSQVEKIIEAFKKVRNQ